MKLQIRIEYSEYVCECASEEEEKQKGEIIKRVKVTKSRTGGGERREVGVSEEEK